MRLEVKWTEQIELKNWMIEENEIVLASKIEFEIFYKLQTWWTKEKGQRKKTNIDWKEVMSFITEMNQSMATLAKTVS